MIKYKWGIVADIVRALSNTSSSGLDLNDTETENALQDLASIMDTMMMNKCDFKKALNIERRNDDQYALWIEKAIETVS